MFVFKKLCELIVDRPSGVLLSLSQHALLSIDLFKCFVACCVQIHSKCMFSVDSDRVKLIFLIFNFLFSSSLLKPLWTLATFTVRYLNKYIHNSNIGSSECEPRSNYMRSHSQFKTKMWYFWYPCPVDWGDKWCVKNDFPLHETEFIFSVWVLFQLIKLFIWFTMNMTVLFIANVYTQIPHVLLFIVLKNPK